MFELKIQGKTHDELLNNIRAIVAGFDKQITWEPIMQPPPVFVEPTPRDVVAPPQPVETIALPQPKESLKIEQTYPPQPVAPLPEPVTTQESEGHTPPPEKDSRGIKWDERIHASSRTVNKDGTWRTKRGVEPSYVVKIEQELLGTAQPVAPSQVVTTPLAPQVAPVTVAPPLPTQTAAHSLATFKHNLIPTLAKLVSDGKITQEYVQTLKNYFGVNQIWEVNDEQLALMFEQFCNAGFLVKAV